MPVSTIGEGIEGQVAVTGRNCEGMNPSTSSNPRNATAGTDVLNSGAVGPVIIDLSDDDEAETCTVKTRSVSELDSSVRTVTKPTRGGDDTQRWSATPIVTFTVQCNACGKWRLIPSKEQYHAIGERMLEHPWVCEEAQAWRENASCQDPTDISENESDILWAVDETIIPKPPPGFTRKVVVRGERSEKFADVYYRTPCGRQLRSIPDVQRFLDMIPRQRRQGVDLSQFSFTSPKPGPNLKKRAFQKVGKVWNRAASDIEGQCSQPAITAGARSSSRSPMYPDPEPLSVMDPTGMPVPKKSRHLLS